MTATVGHDPPGAAQLSRLIPNYLGNATIPFPALLLTPITSPAFIELVRVGVLPAQTSKMVNPAAFPEERRLRLIAFETLQLSLALFSSHDSIMQTPLDSLKRLP